MLIRDGYVMLFAAVALFAASLLGVIPRVISLLFTITYAAYVIFLIETYPKGKDKYHFRSFVPYLLKFQYVFDAHKRLMSMNGKSMPKKGLAKDILWMLFGLAIVTASSKFLVDSAIMVAKLFGVPSTFIGVTLVAVGTSVPELTVSVVAARKGYGEIAIGNVIGSNIANILLIGGITGIILPISIDRISLWFYMPTMIIVSILLLVFIRSGWAITRREGIAFLALYTAFIAGPIYLSNFA
jgi:cation:H+ antiporter